MSEPELPPPPPTGPIESSPPDGTRPGDLTPTWRAVLAIAWLGVFFAYAAVWQASVQLGLATWWVGPRSTPSPTLVRAIPFFVTIVGLLLVVYNIRRLAWITFGLAAASLLIALPDFSTSVSIAMLEVTISAAMMVVAAASLTGRYRVATTSADDAADAADGPPPPNGPSIRESNSENGRAEPEPDTVAWSAPSAPSTTS